MCNVFASISLANNSALNVDNDKHARSSILTFILQNTCVCVLIIGIRRLKLSPSALNLANILRIFVRVEFIHLNAKFRDGHTEGSTVPPEEQKTPHGY